MPRERHREGGGERVRGPPRQEVGKGLSPRSPHEDALGRAVLRGGGVAVLLLIRPDLLPQKANRSLCKF